MGLASVWGLGPRGAGSLIGSTPVEFGFVGGRGVRSKKSGAKRVPVVHVRACKPTPRGEQVAPCRALTAAATGSWPLFAACWHT